MTQYTSLRPLSEVPISLLKLGDCRRLLRAAHVSTNGAARAYLLAPVIAWRLAAWLDFARIKTTTGKGCARARSLARPPGSRQGRGRRKENSIAPRRRRRRQRLRLWARKSGDCGLTL